MNYILSSYTETIFCGNNCSVQRQFAMETVSFSGRDREREGESKQKVLVFVVLTTVLTKVGQHWVQA